MGIMAREKTVLGEIGEMVGIYDKELGLEDSAYGENVFDRTSKIGLIHIGFKYFWDCV